MRRIETSITVDAPLGDVWSVLTDLARFPEWNPFILSARGELRQGEQLAVQIKPEGGRPWAISPVVLSVDPERELRWRGKLMFRGLFDGEHVFRLSETPDGVRLDHFEVFSGVLVPLLWSSLEAPTRAGFEAMNRALKKRSEDVARGRAECAA